MRYATALALALSLMAFASFARAQDLAVNGSFESGPYGWTLNPSHAVSVVTSASSGICAADGDSFLMVNGPLSVGYSYVEVASQSKSAPFGTGIPIDNFVVYLYAYTRVHTHDGRRISYALTLEPGYGTMGSFFHAGAQDQWVAAHATGYYCARDPYNPTGPARPLKIGLELRDSLQGGEYLLLDAVRLAYDGPGVPEQPAIVALLAGLVGMASRRRR